LKKNLDEANKYGLIHLAEHLSFISDSDRLFYLIENRDWRETKVKLDPSYYSLAQDVELAIRLSREALAEAIGQQQPAQYIFSLLSPFCAHSLFLSILHSTASNIPPQLLGVLAHLGQSETALGYADLLNSPDAYNYIAEALEATGRFSAAADVRRRMASILTDVSKSSESEGNESSVPGESPSVESLLEHGDTDAALRVAESISYAVERDKAISKVAMFLVRRGSQEDARAVADKIVGLPSRIACLAFISLMFFKDNHKAFLNQINTLIELAESIDLNSSDILFDQAFDKTNAFIAILGVLVVATTPGDQSTPQEHLALAILERTIETAQIIRDAHDKAMAIIRIAECLLDIKEKSKAIDLLEHATEIATAIVEEKEESYPRVYPVWGIHILEELPALFVQAGNDEKAREIIKQTIVAAKRLGSGGFGGRMIPEDIVRRQARKGLPSLAKQAAMEILPEGEREASLWISADALLDGGQFEEALAIIDDGRIASYRDRRETIMVLTKAALWLTRSKQFARARQICELAINRAQRAPSATTLTWLLSGIGAGLAQSELPLAAQTALDLALQASKSIYRPHKWKLFQDYVDNFFSACTPEQAHQLADWIVKMAEMHYATMEENEDNNIREEWVTQLRIAGKAYATAGEIDQAIATIDRFGNEYNKGRRYLYALGELYRGFERTGVTEVLETFRQAILKFADMLLSDAKDILSYNSSSEYGNGLITDTLVTFARVGAVETAIKEAKKIKDPFYRALCLGTIVYDAPLVERRKKFVGIAQQSLEYTKHIYGHAKSLLRSRTIIALARSGRLDLAEKAIQGLWFAGEEIEMTIDKFGRVAQLLDTRQFRQWGDNIAFAQVLAELVHSGSRWSAYLIADLFIKEYFDVWEDLGAIAPAFGTLNAADDLWHRMQRLLLTPGDEGFRLDAFDQEGIIVGFSDLRYLSQI
jgi:tetratricopeptide (TPR) repeat protein